MGTSQSHDAQDGRAGSDDDPRDPMPGPFRKRRDPFWDDGVGARERQHRSWIESVVAFSLAVLACGLTVAMWIRPLASLVERLAFH